MTKLQRLKKEALEACQFRGHKMKRFVTRCCLAEIVYAHCQDCGMQVVVKTKPQPDDTEISGEAVALYCERQE